jgi:hypothetical protein
MCSTLSQRYPRRNASDVWRSWAGRSVIGTFAVASGAGGARYPDRSVRYRPIPLMAAPALHSDFGPTSRGKGLLATDAG